jgi:FKBP-type peptidyl-prolyl cis-trans isomerase
MMIIMKIMNKLKLLFGAGLILVFVNGCDMAKKYKKEESAQIQEYIQSLGDTAHVLKSSGLYVIELSPGTGRTVLPDDQVSFRYTGMYIDRYPFDSNVKAAAPFRALLGNSEILPGLEEGLSYMKVGGKTRFLTPSSLAYGAYGSPPYIQGYTPLLWEIEMITAMPGSEVPQIAYYIQSVGDTVYSLKPNGLYYFEFLAGTGRTPITKDTITFRYKGMFLDRIVFDSNLSAASPLKTVVGSKGVIAGLEEGVKYMKEGGKARFVIPSALAYGTTGASGTIAPNTPLIFEIELVSVRSGPITK